MRESTIPPHMRFTRKIPDGGYAVELSRNWMKEFFDYEEQGSIEHLERLNKRDKALEIGHDKDGFFCRACNAEVGNDEHFCWNCGQRLLAVD